MIRSLSFVCISLAVILATAGCSSRRTKVTPDLSGADTSFSQPRAFSPDTSDEASFGYARLSPELEREVREKLKPVFFEFNSFTLTQQSMDQLAAAAGFLRQHPTLRILIEGHCDDRGSSEYNMGLGENRARAIRDYLENFGVPRIQLETTSYGKERPEQYNCRDDSCHQRNRRGEFRVLAK